MTVISDPLGNTCPRNSSNLGCLVTISSYSSNDIMPSLSKSNLRNKYSHMSCKYFPYLTLRSFIIYINILAVDLYKIKHRYSEHSNIYVYIVENQQLSSTKLSCIIINILLYMLRTSTFLNIRCAEHTFIFNFNLLLVIP